MNLGQSVVLCHKIDIDENPYNQSIFTMTEDLLRYSKYQRALRYFGNKKQMSKYRDKIDFLFCSVYPEYRKGCFDYYNDCGELLKDTIGDKKIIEMYDKWLVKCLNYALKKTVYKERI